MKLSVKKTKWTGLQLLVIIGPALIWIFYNGPEKLLGPYRNGPWSSSKRANLSGPSCSKGE